MSHAYKPHLDRRAAGRDRPAARGPLRHRAALAASCWQARYGDRAVIELAAPRSVLGRSPGVALAAVDLLLEASPTPRRAVSGVALTAVAELATALAAVSGPLLELVTVIEFAAVTELAAAIDQLLKALSAPRHQRTHHGRERRRPWPSSSPALTRQSPGSCWCAAHASRRARLLSAQ